MALLRTNALLRLVVLLSLGSSLACSSQDSAQIIRVSLKNSDTYQYPTVGGDEEGATISTQARHYRLSEIRRNAETQFVAIYVYQPAPGFVGSDDAEIEIRSGGVGVSAPARIRKIVFHFDVHD
jgi:hypothetical protein